VNPPQPPKNPCPAPISLDPESYAGFGGILVCKRLERKV
jgi:hypothetical protein